jgi:lipoprotein-releasing system ATP-binding protein
VVSFAQAAWGLGSGIQATRLGALVATYNLELAARIDRRVTIRDGQMVEMT